MITQQHPPKVRKRRRLAFSILTLLTLILLFKFGNILISFRILSEDSAWLLYNLVQLSESVILPVVALNLCEPRKYKLRAVLLALAIYNIISAFEYFLLMFAPEYFIWTTGIFVCFVVPFLYRYIIESFHPISDAYTAEDCFLVYKRPHCMLGSICALITAPYGHCSLLIQNREFTYKKGIVIEREFSMTNNLTFKKIQMINISEARDLLGVKWSLRNNCFSTFNRFREKDLY